MSLPKPSPTQQALINGVLSGQSVITDSAAGGGKSTTGLNLVDAYLDKYPDNNVLLIAFQKNVQEEFQKKAKANLSPEKLNQLLVRTSYSLGLELLKLHYPLKAPEMFKANLIIAKLLGGLYGRYGGKNSLQAERMYGTWEETKRRTISLYQVAQARLLSKVSDISTLEAERSIFPERPSRDILEVVVRAMEISFEELERDHKFDFIDMVAVPAKMKYESTRKFDFIIVDEAQDLSPAQFAVVCAYGDEHTQYAFLGDRHQAIMGFCGAMQNAMDLPKEKFGAIEYRIPISYRIPIAVRDLARQFVPDLEARENAPDGWVGNIGLSKAANRVNPGDLVIARNISSLLEFGVMLIAHGKPINFRGQDIKGQIGDIVDAIKRRYGLQNFQFGLQTYLRETVEFIHARSGEDGSENEVDEVRKIVYALERLYVYATSKGFHDFEAFVNELFSEKENRRQPKILMLSCHQAKGLEADNVFAIVPSGGFPYRTANMGAMQMQEENNVAYVAYTRAKYALWLVLPDSPNETTDEVENTPQIAQKPQSPEEVFISKIQFEDWAMFQTDYEMMIKRYRMLSADNRQKCIDDLHMKMRDAIMADYNIQVWMGVANKLGLIRQTPLF